MNEIPVQCVSAGEVEAALIVSPEPLSFRGGFNVMTGAVIDRGHPASAKCSGKDSSGVTFESADLRGSNRVYDEKWVSPLPPRVARIDLVQPGGNSVA
jgi:predicted aconitase with swiveling domain